MSKDANLMDDLGISMEDFQDLELSSEDAEFLESSLIEDEVEEESEEDVENDLDESSEEVEDVDDESSSADAEEEENESDDNNEIYNKFASALVEAGVLSLTDEEKLKEINSFDKLKDVIRDEIRSNEFADLNDHQKGYLEKLSKGLTHEEIVQINNTKSVLENIQDEDLEENEELRRQLIYEDFISKGFSEDKAKKLTDRSFETLSDVEDASEALQNRKKTFEAQEKKILEEREKQIKENEKNQKERLQKIKTLVFDDTKDIFKGFKVNQAVAKKVYENITKPVKYDESGRPISRLAEARLQNPEEFDVKLNLIFELTEGFTKFDKFLSEGKKQAINEFDEKLKSSTFVKQGNSSFRVDTDFDKALSKFEKLALRK